MSTITNIQKLATKPNAELAHLFHASAKLGNWDSANEKWNALYARIHRLQYPNEIWAYGDSRERRLIDAVNHEIDKWR